MTIATSRLFLNIAALWKAHPGIKSLHSSVCLSAHLSILSEDHLEQFQKLWVMSCMQASRCPPQTQCQGGIFILIWRSCFTKNRGWCYFPLVKSGQLHEGCMFQRLRQRDRSAGPCNSNNPLRKEVPQSHEHWWTTAFGLDTTNHRRLPVALDPCKSMWKSIGNLFNSLIAQSSFCEARANGQRSRAREKHL
jgi:hypothetical protein